MGPRESRGKRGGLAYVEGPHTQTGLAAESFRKITSLGGDTDSCVFLPVRLLPVLM